MPKTIENLMLEDHKRLNRLLDELEKDLDDFEKTKKNFSKFKWNLEKHFFIEEKIIFDTFMDISGQETNDTFSLLEEHVRIMDIIKVLEKRLKEKIKPKLHYLKGIIDLHKDFEDRDFYLKLDEKLSIEQKKEISKKIKQIIPA